MFWEAKKLSIKLLLLFRHSVVSDSLWSHGQQPVFPVLHCLPVCSHSYPLYWWCHPTVSSSITLFSFCTQSFPTWGSFPISQLLVSGGQSIGVSASTSILSMNIQDWFPLGLLVWSLCCPRDSQESSPAPQFESICLLYGPNLKPVHDYCKNQSFDYTDLCRQNDVSVFWYTT